MGRSVSSTIHTNIVSPRSLPRGILSTLKCAGARHVAALVGSIIRGDDSSVEVSRRAFGCCSRLRRFLCGGICLGPRTGTRRNGIAKVVRNVCGCLLLRPRTVNSRCREVLRRSKLRHTVYSCVTNVSSRCTISFCSSVCVPGG